MLTFVDGLLGIQFYKSYMKWNLGALWHKLQFWFNFLNFLTLEFLLKTESARWTEICFDLKIKTNSRNLLFWVNTEFPSEPWATLAQLILIFGLSFAFAGRVVKRHGLITGVERPTGGTRHIYLDFKNDVIKIEVSRALNAIVPEMKDNKFERSRLI